MDKYGNHAEESNESANHKKRNTMIALMPIFAVLVYFLGMIQFMVTRITFLEYCLLGINWINIENMKVYNAGYESGFYLKYLTIFIAPLILFIIGGIKSDKDFSEYITSIIGLFSSIMILTGIGFGIVFAMLLLLALFILMGNSSSNVSISKSCTNCGRTVSPSAHQGQRCPYCGAIWVEERTKQK